MARKIIEIDPHSDFALQAEAFLVELAEEDPQRIEKLEAIERRARKQDATVVAGNIALFRASSAGANPTEVQAILAPLLGSKAVSDHYNRTRAAVKIAETMLNAGIPLADLERGLLVQAYHFVFNEQMPSLFDRCHDALWRDFKTRNDLTNLLILFRHSSLRWRLRSRNNKEEKYLSELKTIITDSIAASLGKSEKEVTYYLVRATFYVPKLQST
ncbi:hypothetical protein ACVWYH_004657 [Bradyrhizobium sp. GM24.11]